MNYNNSMTSCPNFKDPRITQSSIIKNLTHEHVEFAREYGAFFVRKVDADSILSVKLPYAG